MTDDVIKSMYIYAVEAKNNGQESIPITFFPVKMTTKNYQTLLDDKKNIPLYRALKNGYDYFEKHHQLPSVSFRNDGSMMVQW